MANNNTVGTKTNFTDRPSIPPNQKLTAAEANQIIDFQKSPAQQITGSLDDTDIIIDGTKQYSVTIVETGATRTITANASGHFKGNFIIQRYQFDVDCTITLSGFDATGNNTGNIAPIQAGTYDFNYYSRTNGINLEIGVNADPSLQDGSGTTFNVNKIDLGGVLSVLATIRKNNNIAYQILKQLTGDDGEYQQFIMSNTEFFQHYHSDAGDLDVSIGMEKSGAGVQAGGGLYISITDLAAGADKISGMNFGKTGLIVMGDIAGSGRAIGTMYDSDYHAKWELLSAANRKRIHPDIEWVELNAPGRGPEVNTWYFATTGSDSNVGSPESPFETLAKVNTEASDGDRVIALSDVTVPATTITKELTISGNGSTTFTLSGTLNIDFSTNKTLTIEGFSLILAVANVITGIGSANDNLTLKNNSAIAILAATGILNLRIENTSGAITTITIDGDLNLIRSTFDLGAFTSNNASSPNINIENATIEATSIDLTGGAASDGVIDCSVSNLDVGTLTLGSSGLLTEDNSSVNVTTLVSGVLSGTPKEFLSQAYASVQPATIKTFTATPTFDFDDGNDHKMTLTGNVTSFATSNEVGSANYDIWIVNDSTAGRTVAAPTGWTEIPGGDTHDTSANAINLYQFKTDPENTIKRFIIKNM